MNKDNLHKLIEKYEKNLDLLNNHEHDEIFKWKAAKQFRDIWFSNDSKNLSFSEKFNYAKKEFSILTDNSYVSPANGIVKIAEKDEEAVENLFENVLFADDGGNISIRQNNMEKFLEEIDKLRMKHYPQSFKYKQDRHAVSCYLAFFNPDKNYIYRYSDAEAFAQNIEFGKDLGSGESFRLDFYYEMCDLVVEALKEHPDLLDKHDKYITDKHYYDESRHIMAFDLMYCCRTYDFYEGMTHIAKKDSIKEFTEAKAKEQEELKRKAQITELEKELHILELEAEKYSAISLLNVEVFQRGIGAGMVISQDINKIKVKFENCEKEYIIDKKYFMRPTFENDKEIVEIFTRYGELYQKILYLKNKLHRI